MKIAVLTHFYPPEPCAAATRIAALVAALARAGHDVTVLTNFPSFPNGRFKRGDRGWRRIERTADARIVRLGSALVRGMPGARLIHWVSSALSATLYLLASRTRYDAIAVSTPPITLAMPALAGAARHRARLVVDVRDVFPDIAIAMGEWPRDGLLARAAEWTVRRLYGRANLVVAVTPTALEQIRTRGIERSRLMLARNAAELAALPESIAPPQAPFTAIYAGNLGLATDVDLLLDAAVRTRDDEIRIEIVGGGALFSHVATRVAQEDLRNVGLRGSMPRAEAMEAMRAADVCLIPLRRGIHESVPTKLYDAIAAGSLPIVAAEGEARDEGLKLGARCVPAGDPDALAQELRRCRDLGRTHLRALARDARIRLQAREDRAGIMDALADRISALA